MAKDKLNVRNLLAAERLKGNILEGASNFMQAVYCEMYRRHLRGESPLDARDVFIAGNFKHGRKASQAVEKALSDGYITRGPEPVDEKSFRQYIPTEKLIATVQEKVDQELSAWAAILHSS